ncbi:MAG: response regulator [Gammaproteobacteria bacterium]|nr:response regulator [Gammaproteobacteria bacterium]
MQQSALKILIVDDTPSYLSTFAEILATENYEIIVAPDGMGGWKRFTDDKPDLTLIDVNMPRMDGFTLTSRIKSKNPKLWVPVILMSANASILTQLKGYQAGCDDFLSKPVDPSILLAKIAVFQRIIQQIARVPLKEKPAELKVS